MGRNGARAAQIFVLLCRSDLGAAQAMHFACFQRAANRGLHTADANAVSVSVSVRGIPVIVMSGEVVPSDSGA